jgi:hypothetical protein
MKRQVTKGRSVMAVTSRSPRLEPRIDLHRLWWAGLLTVAAALGANAIVRSVAVALFTISPAFHNLAWIHFTWVTFAAVGTAVLVFAVIARWSDRPVHLYRRVAAVALLVSFIPTAGLVPAEVTGGSPAAIATLLVMHVVDAAICVWLLPFVTRAREPGSERIGESRAATAARR